MPIKKNPDPLTEAVDRVTLEMSRHEIGSEEYVKALQYLERLHKLHAAERRNPVSSDAVIGVVGNLLGILLIVAYEEKHIITSKGLGFIMKTK